MKLETRYADEVNEREFSIFFTNYPDVVFVLVSDDGEDVAIATADNLTDTDDAEDTDWIEVHNLGVKETGHGYGSQLVKLLQGKYAAIEVHEVLSEAEGFWTKMRFEQNGEVWIWNK
jgi:N-acetylglutamate synthase-like GNAT family acetyltransferase